MPSPIGVSFLPSQDNQQQGSRQGQLEGDIGEALKIIGLRLPSVVGARSITPASNLSGGGSGAVDSLSGVTNPNAAAFEALIRALLGHGSRSSGGGVGGGVQGLAPNIPAPNIIPGVNQGEPGPDAFRPGPVDLSPRPQAPSAPVGYRGGLADKYQDYFPG